MYAHEIEHRTTGVAFGNGTPGGVPATDQAGPGGAHEQSPGAVPGEPTVRADPGADDAPRATGAGGTAHV